MLSTDQLLENAARDGSIELEDWPRVLETVLARLKEIVHSDFPLPRVPVAFEPESLDPEVVALTPLPPSSRVEGKEGPEERGDDGSAGTVGEERGDVAMEGEEGSQSSTKENDAPVREPSSSQEILRFPPTTPKRVEERRSTDWRFLEPGTLPPDLLSSFTVSTHMLATSFQHAPPYTVQRLAELVLYPKRHYRFLPSYLRALDRVVSVSSPASDFPLPALQAGTGSGFLTNGELNGSGEVGLSEGLGSDEALGGALLTPIPWLKPEAVGNVQGGNGGGAAAGGQSSPGGGEGELRSEGVETIDGPTGPGRIETVSVTVNGIMSTAPQAHPTTLQAADPTSPSLSDQSDASTPSHASTASTASTTEAQLRASGGVTQGELLRQEQEAGVVPVAQSQPRRSLLASGAVAVGRETPSQALAATRTENQPLGAEISGEEREAADIGMIDSPATSTLEGMASTSETTPTEAPHARGPGEIDMADTGPQRNNLSPDNAGKTLPALDMHAAVGRRSLSPNPPPPSDPSQPQPDTPHPATVASGTYHNPEPRIPDDALGPHSSPTAARVARAAPKAEAQAAEAENDDSGKPGRDPEGVRQEVELMSEGLQEREEAEVKDGDGDVVLADLDGREDSGEGGLR
ncbi:hypothetical protein MBLNU230_g5461t1 [Neophaeotheca triangularis]